MAMPRPAPRVAPATSATLPSSRPTVSAGVVSVAIGDKIVQGPRYARAALSGARQPMIRSRPWLFAASFACALACSAPAEGSFPGRNGELAYHGRASAQGLLYFRAADGDRLRRLRVPGRPAEPAFSPLGRRIAFASNGAIWVMQADGS